MQGWLKAAFSPHVIIDQISLAAARQHFPKGYNTGQKRINDSVDRLSVFILSTTHHKEVDYLAPSTQNS